MLALARHSPSRRSTPPGSSHNPSHHALAQFRLRPTAISRRCSTEVRPLAAVLAAEYGRRQSVEHKLGTLDKTQLSDVLLGFVKRGELASSHVLENLPAVKPEIDHGAERMLNAPPLSDLRFALGTAAWSAGSEWTSGCAASSSGTTTARPPGRRSSLLLTRLVL